MIELTWEQHQALTGGDSRVRDVATDETYVLIPEAVYARLQNIIEEWPAETVMNEVMADDDANDPWLESYQHFGGGTS